MTPWDTSFSLSPPEPNHVKFTLTPPILAVVAALPLAAATLDAEKLARDTGARLEGGPEVRIAAGQTVAAKVANAAAPAKFGLKGARNGEAMRATLLEWDMLQFQHASSGRALKKTYADWHRQSWQSNDFRTPARMNQCVSPPSGGPGSGRPMRPATSRRARSGAPPMTPETGCPLPGRPERHGVAAALPREMAIGRPATPEAQAQATLDAPAALGG
jgi:hypothetical protein